MVMFFFGKELAEKYSANCNNGRITRVSDLVEIVDSFYKQEINRSFSRYFIKRKRAAKSLYQLNLTLIFNVHSFKASLW